jgi:hypothetical protein
MARQGPALGRAPRGGVSNKIRAPAVCFKRGVYLALDVGEVGNAS